MGNDRTWREWAAILAIASHGVDDRARRRAGALAQALVSFVATEPVAQSFTVYDTRIHARCRDRAEVQAANVDPRVLQQIVARAGGRSASHHVPEQWLDRGDDRRHRSRHDGGATRGYRQTLPLVPP